MKKKIALVITITAVLCVLAACAPPVSPSGNLVVNLPGGARSLHPSPDFVEEITYTITATGPGAAVTQTLGAGQTTAVFDLVPGDWTINVTASVDGVPIGGGSARVAVTGRSGQSVSIDLDFYDEGDFDAAQTDIVTGIFTVTDEGGWNDARDEIRANGNYIINIIGTVSITDTPLSFDSVTGITVSIRGGGTLALGSGDGSLLTIGTNQTVVLRDITLEGIADNTAALVHVDGGALAMHSGAVITGNTNTGDGYGGGVIMSNGGTFTMDGGTITGNTATGDGYGHGGGVAVYGGTFTMSSGTISDNTATTSGGGVHVAGDSAFTMRGGTIGGNTATTSGGGGVSMLGTFTKTAGVIYGSDETGIDGNGNPLRNISFGSGHAVYADSDHFRNAAVTPAEPLALSGSDYTGVWYDYDVPSGGTVIPVGTAAELAAIIGHITDSTKNNSANAYVLTADIDLGGYGPWTPIGKVGSIDGYGGPTGGLEPFKGYFYGKGRRILGLELSGGTTYKIGLFGYTDGARIQDLVVELKPVSITVSGSQTVDIGGIAGHGNDTHIANCGVYSTGTVTVTGAVSYALKVAGIVSNLYSGSISGSYAALNLDVTNTGTHLYVDGIVSNGSDSSYENCYFAGAITGSCGYTALSGITHVGVDIENCYAAGTLTNTNTGASYSSTAGIYTGNDGPSVSNSAVLLSALSDSTGGRVKRVQYYASTGGMPNIVLANNYAYSGMTLNNSTVTDDATEPENTQNGLGKSAADLKTQSTYETGLSWDFTDVWEMGPSSYPFPILKWQQGVVHVPADFTVIE